MKKGGQKPPFFVLWQLRLSLLIGLLFVLIAFASSVSYHFRVAPSSSSIYKIYVSLIAVMLIGGSIYSSIIQQDIFPFAAFMMYSSPRESRDLYMLKSFCHKKDNSVVAVTEFDTWLQEVDYFGYLDRSAPLPLAPESMKVCQQAARKLLTDLSGEGCMKITLNRYYWKLFTGPRALTPDKNELYCEVGVSDGH